MLSLFAFISDFFWGAKLLHKMTWLLDEARQSTQPKTTKLIGP